ncbi:hypothetical protein E4U59_007908 [Claviceps monticola]|nr:hypothetical protein E4U59_007908 [Claviceps monticola]
MASSKNTIHHAATRVNSCLMDYVVSLSDESALNSQSLPQTHQYRSASRLAVTSEKADGSQSKRNSLSSIREQEFERFPTSQGRSTSSGDALTIAQSPDLDYTAAVNSLTLLFLNDHEATRVAALTWLIMLHRKAPRKVLAFNDGTFPALLKTLSDPSDAVVTKDLQLLSQISRNSEDDYFANFMVNLLQLFSTDRKLLETRGNLIIRQLCLSLSPERIYRTLADCIEKEEDVEFASIMVQNLNNNLITAPQLAEVRKRLRNLETKDGQTLFVALFHLRLQLLEPEKYPYLYKCMYGILMLLPQSSAFAALKNRLNSVSSIGYIHVSPRSTSNSTSALSYDRPTRLKGREDSGIKWIELLEKFRSVQERARRVQRHNLNGEETSAAEMAEYRAETSLEPKSIDRSLSTGNTPMVSVKDAISAPSVKRSSLGRQFGRLGGAVSGKSKRS